MKKHFLKKRQKGVTLVELLVAVGIFTIVMLVAVGGLLRIVSANQQAQGIQSVMSNLNFSLESMTRNMRMGSKYHCGEISIENTTAESLQPKDCDGEFDTAIAFVSSSGDLVTYRLAEKAGKGRIDRSIKSGGKTETSLAVTASEMSIDRLRFFVSGTAKGDTEPSRVRITLGGKAKVNSKIETRFDLQTFVVQRVRDN